MSLPRPGELLTKSPQNLCKNLPIKCLRTSSVFRWSPSATSSFFRLQRSLSRSAGRAPSVRSKQAMTGDRDIFLATQHDATVDEPTAERDLSRSEHLGRILQAQRQDNGQIKVVVEGRERGQSVRVEQDDGRDVLRPRPQDRFDRRIGLSHRRAAAKDPYACRAISCASRRMLTRTLCMPACAASRRLRSPTRCRRICGSASRKNRTCLRRSPFRNGCKS